MANVLPREKRIAVLHALVNANSERSAADLAGVNARTVARLAVEFGTGAARLHDKIARDLVCADIECDETWSYVGKKQARVTPEDPPEVGEAYTWTAAAARYKGADLKTLCAAWVENQRFLDGARPGNYDPSALAVRDVLKEEADRFGLRNSLDFYCS